MSADDLSDDLSDDLREYLDLVDEAIDRWITPEEIEIALQACKGRAQIEQLLREEAHK